MRVRGEKAASTVSQLLCPLVNLRLAVMKTSQLTVKPHTSYVVDTVWSLIKLPKGSAVLIFVLGSSHCKDLISGPPSLLNDYMSIQFQRMPGTVQITPELFVHA